MGSGPRGRCTSPGGREGLLPGSSAVSITSSIRQAPPAGPCSSSRWVVAVFLAAAARLSAEGTGYRTSPTSLTVGAASTVPGGSRNREPPVVGSFSPAATRAASSRGHRRRPCRRRDDPVWLGQGADDASGPTSTMLSASSCRRPRSWILCGLAIIWGQDCPPQWCTKSLSPKAPRCVVTAFKGGAPRLWSRAGARSTPRVRSRISCSGPSATWSYSGPREPCLAVGVTHEQVND